MDARSNHSSRIEDIIMRNDESDNNNEILNCHSVHRSTEAASAMPDYAGTSPAANSRVREYVAPHNEIEAGVAEILGELLMVEYVGIHDNFIILGGESLLAARAAWRIRERFGCEVTLRVILTGTVADVAAEILANRQPET
jgi:hypothetical protein